jgi:hypothetical protein
MTRKSRAPVPHAAAPLSDRERLRQLGQSADHQAGEKGNHRQLAQLGKRRDQVLREIVAVARAEEKVRIRMTIRTDLIGVDIREVFQAEMQRAVPWGRLEALIAPHYPEAGGGRRPYPLATMLRIHCLQQWYRVGDPAMEEELYEIASMRQFAGLSLARGTVPDETTILNFGHFLEQHCLSREVFDTVKAHIQAAGLLLRQGAIVDETIISAPSSTKNSTGERDPEMHQTKKANQWWCAGSCSSQDSCA